MIQAWPKPINYWTFGTGEMIVANDKFVVEENELNGYKFQLVLVIKKLEKVQGVSKKCPIATCSLNLFQRSDYTFLPVFWIQNFEPDPSKHFEHTHAES